MAGQEKKKGTAKRKKRGGNTEGAPAEPPGVGVGVWGGGGGGGGGAEGRGVKDVRQFLEVREKKLGNAIRSASRANGKYGGRRMKSTGRGGKTSENGN